MRFFGEFLRRIDDRIYCPANGARPFGQSVQHRSKRSGSDNTNVHVAVGTLLARGDRAEDESQFHAVHATERFAQNIGNPGSLPRDAPDLLKYRACGVRLKDAPVSVPLFQNDSHRTEGVHFLADHRGRDTRQARQFPEMQRTLRFRKQDAERRLLRLAEKCVGKGN